MEVSWGDWLLLDSGLGHWAFNMGMDEAMLEAMPELGKPVLRFYGWREQAASFGYFQRFNEVEQSTALRPLVRRPTAGGIVPHANDWTYSLAIPTGHPWYLLTARQSYRQVHEWIRAAFGRLGVNSVLARSASKSDGGQCFAGYEESDLLYQGQKIAGAAQRRRRDGLLIQGSVQPPAARLERKDWQQAMSDVGQFEHRIRWIRSDSPFALEPRAQALADRKYSQEAYNRKR
jgi:lipoate-protein ligase A